MRFVNSHTMGAALLAAVCGCKARDVSSVQLNSTLGSLLNLGDVKDLDERARLCG